MYKEDINKKQLVFVEDESQQAKKFYAHLKLKDEIPSFKYLKDLESLKELLGKKGVKRFYWVDINLGKGRPDEGIEAIKIIRGSDPDALIIVYSGYPDKEHACLEAGADLFFEKDPVTYEDDLWQIKNRINRELEEKGESWETTIIMYSQIVDIDDDRDLVRLNCKLEKKSAETFERVFPLRHFKGKEKLVVDQSILVRVLERPGEVRFIFEKIKENYYDDEENIDLSGLDDSNILGSKDDLEF